MGIRERFIAGCDQHVLGHGIGGAVAQGAARDRQQGIFSERLARRGILVRVILVLALALSVNATLIGCVARASPKPRPIEPEPDPISAPELPELTVAAPANVVSAIHQILGDAGDFPPKKPLQIAVGGGFTVTVPVGTSATYTLTDGSYHVRLNEPKPTVSGNLFGLLSPRIAAVVVKPDNTGVASIEHALGTYRKTFRIDWDGDGSLPGIVDLPEVWAYSMPNCPPCEVAKKELAAATDLPFKVVWKEDAPAWLTSRPGFWWHIRDSKPSQEDVQNTRQATGWRGLKDFLSRWEASREPKGHQ